MSRIARVETHSCTAGPECQHQDRPIAIQYDARDIPIGYSEEGLISSPDGWRHTGCPDLRLRELTPTQNWKALSDALEKAMARMDVSGKR